MKKVIETLMILLLALGFGWAKSSQNNWDNLKQLAPGQKIQVVDTKMKTLKGTFVSASDEAISLQVGKNEESVPRANVVRVSVRDTSHRTRNMLLLAGVGAGVGLGAGFGIDQEVRHVSGEGGSYLYAPVLAATGAGARGRIACRLANDLPSQEVVNRICLIGRTQP